MSMPGQRRRNSKRAGNNNNSSRPPIHTETTQPTEPPPDTDSARQRIVTEVEDLKKKKAENSITVGHEVETKKYSYVIAREIAKGRMSNIFEVRRNKDDKVLGMKAHLPTDIGKATILRHEAHVYQELSILSKKLDKEDLRFFNIYDYGECSDGQFLFMTLGGESLANVLSDEKVPNYQTALDLSLQMLNAIEQIHQLGFIHCRIRPRTFITGLKPRERYTLFLINFSFSRMANPSRAETTITRNQPQVFDRYAPRCQHNGAPYNRRDDLESWFYITCDIFHPHFLPWSSDKRLKSAQMAEMKDKLMRGELYHRYTVMPRPFQAFAGAINETDAKVPNYSFFKDALTEEAKLKNCVFNSPWDFKPTADLPPVPEILNQTRSDFEFNQCVKNPTAFNFGTEKCRTVPPPDDVKEQKDGSAGSGVEIFLPSPNPQSSPSPKVEPTSPEIDKAKNEQAVLPPSKSQPAKVNFGTEKSRTVPPPDSGKEQKDGDDARVKAVLPNPKSQQQPPKVQAPPPEADKTKDENVLERNDSVYFAVPTNGPTIKNASLKSQNSNQPPSATENQSAYFKPK